MKKFFMIFSILLTVVLITGCQKDIKDNEPAKIDEDNSKFVLLDGAIVIDNSPDITVTRHNEELNSVSSSVAMKRMENAPVANDYLFTLVGGIGTWTIESHVVQASHVKFSEGSADDGFVFVSYNYKGEHNIGGVAIFRYAISYLPNGKVEVDVKPHSRMLTPLAQVNAIDLDGNKLYVAGASVDPRLGYNEEEDDPAFFMVMELDANNQFAPVNPEAIRKLGSFQATSIKYTPAHIYVTTGDAAMQTKGGLYIYEASGNYGFLEFIGKPNARSVDADENNVFLMQSEHARITRFNLDGSAEHTVYEGIHQAVQQNAKSETIVWEDLLFVAMNESGVLILDKQTGAWRGSIDAPGTDGIDEVTNSLSMNADIKRSKDGEYVRTKLLLLANGGKGVYWYEIWDDAPSGSSVILTPEDNSILGGDRRSTNYVASRGNLAFVADGLGGLNVLYIEVVEPYIPPPPPTATVRFMGLVDEKTGNRTRIADGIHYQVIELDKENVIDWDTVFDEYDDFEWENVNYDESWVIGWVTSEGVVLNSGVRPTEKLTENMFYPQGSEEIHLYAIIDPPRAIVNFNGLYNVNNQTRTSTAPEILYTREIIIGVDEVFEWEKIFFEYREHPWTRSQYDESWVTGWITDNGEGRFNEKEPSKIVFTEDMVENDGTISVKAIIAPPTARVIFKGVNYVNSEIFVDVPELHSQIVQLEKECEIDWSLVYDTYSNSEDMPTPFLDIRITGWVTSNRQFFAGQTPDIEFTTDMFTAPGSNEIHMYVVIRPAAHVSFRGFMFFDAQIPTTPNSWSFHALTAEFGQDDQISEWRPIYTSYNSYYLGNSNYSSERVIGWRVIGAETEFYFPGPEPEIIFTEEMRNVVIWENRKSYVVTMYAVLTHP